jgi:hypothetical protein
VQCQHNHKNQKIVQRPPGADHPYDKEGKALPNNGAQYEKHKWKNWDRRGSEQGSSLVYKYADNGNTSLADQPRRCEQQPAGQQGSQLGSPQRSAREAWPTNHLDNQMQLPGQKEWRPTELWSQQTRRP